MLFIYDREMINLEYDHFVLKFDFVKDIHIFSIKSDHDPQHYE